MAAGLPTLTTSLRGMVAGSVAVQGLRGPVHSGMWGGAVPDACGALIRALDSVTDERGAVDLPGLPPGAIAPAAWDACADLPYDLAKQCEDGGIVAQWDQPGAEAYRQAWYIPQFTVNAIHAGGSPGQAGNVVNGSAWARFSLRIIPGCDALQAKAALEQQLSTHLEGFKLTWDWETASDGWAADHTAPAIQAGLDALSQGYGRSAVLGGCGGSIPLAEQLQQALGGTPVLLFPVEDPQTNAHGYDESVNLSDLAASTRSLIHFFQIMCEQQSA